MTTPAPFQFHPGTAPLLISFPHVGTYVPPALAARLTPKAREVHDTDWHLPRLYDFARGLGASLLIATHSRYVIDLNRPPDGASLYPGQSVTALCPVDDFDGERIYLPRFFDGKLPDLNLGTADGTSCAPELAQELLRVAGSAPGFTAVLNGRFKGGHITRAHGRPHEGVHAVQLEMTQSSYMQEAMPFDYLPEQAARIQPTLERLLQTALAFARRAASSV